MQPNENTRKDFVAEEKDRNFHHYLVSRKLHDERNQEYRKEWHIVKIAKHLQRNFESQESITANGFSDIFLIWDALKQTNPQAEKGSGGGGAVGEVEVKYRQKTLSMTKEQMLELCDKEGLRVNKNNISAQTLAKKISVEFGDLEPDE